MYGRDYNQNGNPHTPQTYGAQRASTPATAEQYGRSDDVELGIIGGGDSQAAVGNRSKHDILNQTKSVEFRIRQLEHSIEQLQRAWFQSLDPGARVDEEDDSSHSKLSRKVLDEQKALAAEITRLKSTPGAANPSNAGHLNLASERLQSANRKYQTAEMEYRRRVNGDIARQYTYINPNATQQEIQTAIDNFPEGVFSQALLQSDRRGQAQSALREVQIRHEAIQKIESEMIELGQLFTQMNETILAQEPVVTNLAEQSEDVKTSMANATTQLDGAVQKAKDRNKKKRWCLVISIAIVLVIALIIGIAVGVLHPPQMGSS